jgi:hypothetical protein
MDFTGDAVIARFGFMLGFSAAALPNLVGWIPGDEFARAQAESGFGAMNVRCKPRLSVAKPPP